LQFLLFSERTANGEELLATYVRTLLCRLILIGLLGVHLDCLNRSPFKESNQDHSSNLITLALKLKLLELQLKFGFTASKNAAQSVDNFKQNMIR